MATNISSIGTGKDYTTITAWEAAVQGDLVTAGDIEKGECYDQTYTENVTIDGSTTDASNYLWLTVAAGEGHVGTAAGGGAKVTNSGNAHVFNVADPYTLIENLIIESTSTGSSDEGIRVNQNQITIRNCIIRSTTGTSNKDGVYLGPNLTMTVNIENCVIYGFSRGGIHLQNWDGSATVTGNIKNCTIAECGKEADGGGVAAREGGSSTTTVNCDNTICIDNDDDPSADDFREYQNQSNVTWSGDRNISSDTSATGKFGAGTGVGNRNSRSFTTSTTPGAGDWVVVTNTTGGSEDYHLQSSAENDAEGAGLDLSGTFTDDYEGDTRSDWDIGADEIVAAGGTPRRSMIIGKGFSPQLLLLGGIFSPLAWIIRRRQKLMGTK